MKVLVACEESQTVCKAFRALGHEAYSCDILPCSGGHPEWHIQGDVKQFIPIQRSDSMDRFDLVLSFPPCTDLCNSGARWFDNKRKSGEQRKSIDFYIELASISNVVENPNGIMNSDMLYVKHYYPELYCKAQNLGVYEMAQQIIQPWQFGHKETKGTVLKLYEVEPLKYTYVVGPPPKANTIEEMLNISRGWNKIHRCPPGPDRARIRSRTYEGIAKAMAEQWGGILNQNV